MAEVDAIGAASGATSASTGQTATDAFGMGFEDLLRIVLTQLTYQDPLKPMENFEFVSQLAQFSQIQQTQTMSERILGILQAQGANQATSVLGRTVDVPAGQATISGLVESISFQTGEPRLTIKTSDGRTISNIALSSVSRIALED
ncbi:flagellar hook assembly protein FlgD [Vitreimonas flagellata]|uniref:flagellar hook assembly protein FlgD n=1 Tax=Vitreimonas flagellata TaxID=2560861 RepID=UPI001074A502|nr:flagellar hook capping FlgD N-terminal domain-containing protein [Vitreimonas flagellata]